MRSKEEALRFSKDEVLCASGILCRKNKPKFAVEDFLSILSFVLAIKHFQKFYTSHIVGENKYIKK